MKKLIAILLVAAFLLSGCSEPEPVQSGENLMEGIQPAKVYSGEELDTDSSAFTDFGLRLFQASMGEGKNTLISPLSVLYALSMTANGADGNTLTQMEAVLGQPINVLNGWLSSYMEELSQPDGEKLHLANGIWFKDDPKLTVEESFLKTNADYYGAGIYKAAFDEETLTDINRFVEENTDGMVKDILDEIPEEAVMYLVNALAFDAQWQEVYKENQIHEDVFTTESGAQQDIELMYSEEYAYLEDDKTTGFLKYYDGRRYAFVALLPKEGVTVADYVQSLTGQHLQQMLSDPQDVTVHAAIPKFETEFDTQMSEVLKSMGMTDAFDWTVADFSRLGSYEGLNICINRVLHKTFISVAEQGTKAGAATVVEMAAEGAMEIEDLKIVTLDRPFLYMIVDTETQLPLFMGTLMHVEEEGFLFVEPNENGHVHSPAQEPEVCTYPTVGYCGNIVTTVKLDGEEHSFMYDDSVVLTDILTNQLTYDPDVICRCIADITVETELGGPYYVNLDESFARCDAGQAPLTAQQAETIRDILDRL